MELRSVIVGKYREMSLGRDTPQFSLDEVAKNRPPPNDVLSDKADQAREEQPGKGAQRSAKRLTSFLGEP